MRRVPSILCAGIPLLFCAIGSLGAQILPPKLTLTEAVQIALKGQPSLRAVDSGRQIAEASLAEATSSRLPKAQVSETITRGNNPVYAFGSLLEQAQFGPQNFSLGALNSPSSVSNFRTEMKVRLPVFDQHQRESNIRQAKIGIEQSGMDKESAEQQIRYDVIRSYYGVLLATAQKELADTAVRMADEDLKHAADMRQAGITVDSDLLAAQVQRAEFRLQQIQSAADVSAAVATLNTAMGQPIDTRRTIDTTSGDRPFTVDSQAELIRTAMDHRPDYLRAAAAIRSAEQGVHSVRSESLPRVEAFGSYGTSGGRPTSGSADYVAGASISLNVFDAGHNARVDRARAQKDLATAQLDQLANQIRLDVVRAYQNQVAAEERLNVARLSVAQGEEAHRIVQDRYQAGLTTITEVLRAQTALVRARTNLIASQYEQRVGYAAVLYATGMLTSEQPFTDRGAN